MPLYIYNCDNCGTILEVKQGINENPLITCKACHGSLKRIIQSTNFVLKGSGWFNKPKEPIQEEKDDK